MTAAGRAIWGRGGPLPAPRGAGLRRGLRGGPIPGRPASRILHPIPPRAGDLERGILAPAGGASCTHARTCTRVHMHAQAHAPRLQPAGSGLGVRGWRPGPAHEQRRRSPRLASPGCGSRLRPARFLPPRLPPGSGSAAALQPWVRPGAGGGAGEGAGGGRSAGSAGRQVCLCLCLSLSPRLCVPARLSQARGPALPALASLAARLLLLLSRALQAPAAARSAGGPRARSSAAATAAILRLQLTRAPLPPPQPDGARRPPGSRPARPSRDAAHLHTGLLANGGAAERPRPARASGADWLRPRWPRPLASAYKAARPALLQTARGARGGRGGGGGGTLRFVSLARRLFSS